MSKIFIIFLIFALPYNAASHMRRLFHFSLRTGEMAESFGHMYVNATIEMKAKYKVVLLWNDTNVCKPGALTQHWIVDVSFASGVEKGLRRDKCRLVKMSSRDVPSR